MPGLEKSVIEFVSAFTGFKPERLHRHTTLYGDLGVAGDDGWDLIQAYGKKFQVDLTGFEPVRHFGEEGVSVLAPFALLWMVLRFPFRQRRTPEEEAHLRVVRIADLVAFARAGRWMISAV